MKIIESKIPDITESNLDYTKIELANEVISNMKPLFATEYKTVKNSVKKLTSDLEKTKSEILSNKNTLQSFSEKIERKKKIKILIDRINNYINISKGHDIGLRHEMVVLLKVIDTLDDKTLEYHMEKTLKAISKRFAKS